MRVLPRSRAEKIEWFELRLDRWAENPAAIGLTTQHVFRLENLVANARQRAEEAAHARNQSTSATLAFHEASDEMEEEGRALIRTIKAYAQTSNDPNVYVLAEVPPPAPRSPLGPPGRPHTIKIRLGSTGQIRLTWEADNAMPSTGVYFILSRRLDGDQTFSILGGSGTKTFTDNSIPAGTACATYLITPYRGDLAGEPGEQFAVQFGRSDHAEETRLGQAA